MATMLETMIFDDVDDPRDRRIAALEAELHAIKYEVMGGEDVPMSANAVTIDDVKTEMERLRHIERCLREAQEGAKPE